MACGTPVIAYRRGSMPEVIDDRITGFVVDGVDQAVARVAHAELLDRRTVRDRAQSRFGVERMVDEYLQLYERVIADWPSPAAHMPWV